MFSMSSRGITNESVLGRQLPAPSGMLSLPRSEELYDRPHMVPSLTEPDYSDEPAASAVVANTGDSDVSPESIPSQFLLFRGLEASVTEELFAKGVAKLYKLPDEPVPKKAKVGSTTASSNFGAPDGSIKRVFVVRRRGSDDSCRYGFAEFRAAEACSRSISTLLTAAGCASCHVEV